MSVSFGFLSLQRSRYRWLKQRLRLRLRWRAWRRTIDKMAVPSTVLRTEGFKNLLIIPSDPWLIVGSRGDDAMVTTMVAQAKTRNPHCGIGMMCVAKPLPKVVQDMGALAVPLWSGNDYEAFIDAVEQYDAVAVIGADVMDGHFSAADAFRAWSFADLAARRGRRTMVSGFSFSLTPEAELADILRSLCPELAVFARDRRSKDRFDAFSAVPSKLVADSAFLLPPSQSAPDFNAAAQWTAEQHLAGRFVCAINTHVMIFPDNNAAMMSQLVGVLAEALISLSSRFPVALLLVPHDFRDDVRGDNAALKPLFLRLSVELGSRVFHAAAECRASDIKGLVGLADMLVTGRMHLGVGALAMGVPMWAINPQDKFTGLFEHFGLPDQRLKPMDALVRPRLEAFLEEAFVCWSEIQARVRASVPRVLRLAELNFAPLD